MKPDEFQIGIESAIDGRLSDEDGERLAQHLRSDPASMREYVLQLRLHALLSWEHGRVEAVSTADPPPPAAPGSARSTRWLAWAALAAAVAIVCGSILFPTTRGNPRLALVQRLAVVQRAAGTDPPAVGTEIGPGPLKLASGELALDFDSGVSVVLSGRVEAEVIDGMTLRLTTGRLTARLRPGGRTGFTVRTPTAEVVDLSTEFGVDVQDGGATDVVVFEGAVEVSRTAAAEEAPVRMVRGEAVRVAAVGGGRIMAVHRAPGSAAWSTRHSAGVILAVADDLVEPAAAQYYQIVPSGLRKGALAYADRDYTWDDVPKPLEGADLVMTFNALKRQADLEPSVALTAPARLYVFVDDRAPPPPWLAARGFVQTPWKIGQRESTPGNPVRPFSVWRRRVSEAGVVRLGANDAKSMYAVAAAPEKIVVACLGDDVTAGSGHPDLLQRWLGGKYAVRNYGVGGATLLSSGDKPCRDQPAYAMLKSDEPQAVLVMLGTNDTKPANYRRIKDFAVDLESLVDDLRSLPSRPQVLLCLPPPVYGEGNSGVDDARLKAGVLPAIARVARDRKLVLIDLHAALAGKPELFKDRVHPIGGQEFFVRAILPPLRDALPPPPPRANLLRDPGGEAGLDGWIARGGVLSRVESPVHGGRFALRLAARSQNWHGPGQDVLAGLQAQGPGVYEVRGSARLAAAGAKGSGTMVLLIADDRGMRYLKSAPRPLYDDVWAEFYDDLDVAWEGDLKSALLYLETNDAAQDELVVDDFVLSPPTRAAIVPESQ